MIDLHTHSTASDGTDSPADLVRRAAAGGLSAIALTDHDTTEGLAEAVECGGRSGIRVVRGCELSCRVSHGTLHLLVLFVDDDHPLQSRLGTLRAARDLRNVRIVEVLSDHGIDVTIDEVLREAGPGSVGRPHVASVLLQKGYVTSIDEAFDRWLAKGRPAYVERERLDAVDAIDLAHAGDAVTVLAHPYSLGLAPDDLDAFVAHLATAGLDGIEVEYGRYLREERTALLELAERHGLSPSGGSDYHGSYKPDLSVGTGLGDLHVPDEWLDALEARRTLSSG